MDGSIGTDCGFGDEVAARAAIEGSMEPGGGEAKAVIASRSVGRIGGIGVGTDAIAVASARELWGADCRLARWGANPAVGSALAAAGGGDMSAAKSAGLLRIARAPWMTSWFGITGSFELSAPLF
jgi:hypothetical protein